MKEAASAGLRWRDPRATGQLASSQEKVDQWGRPKLFQLRVLWNWALFTDLVPPPTTGGAPGLPKAIGVFDNAIDNHLLESGNGGSRTITPPGQSNIG
jgi:hypothetical protein